MSSTHPYPRDRCKRLAGQSVGASFGIAYKHESTVVAGDSFEGLDELREAFVGHEPSGEYKGK